MFRNCEFTNCGLFGILFFESPGSVRNCLIDGSHGRGISMIRGGDNLFVTNSIVQNCATSGIVCEDYSRPTLVNNVIRSCGYNAVQLENQCRPMMLNNIITGPYRYGVHAERQSIPHLDYNDVWADLNDPETAALFLGHLLPDTISTRDGISALPGFSGATDFHLGAGSPCIDTGHPDPAYNDADGSRNDMGAYGGPAGGAVGRLQRSNRLMVSR